MKVIKSTNPDRLARAVVCRYRDGLLPGLLQSHRRSRNRAPSNQNRQRMRNRQSPTMTRQFGSACWSSTSASPDGS